MKSLSHVRFLATPWTAAYQAPPSMGFSRQQYWSGVPLPSPFQCLGSGKYAQFSSVAQSCPTLCNPMNHSMLGLPAIPNSQSPPKLMSIQSVMPYNHLILLHSIFPSIRVFSNESALHIRWPKYWSFSFNISPSKEIPGLISFRMDWLDLFAVQGTLKSLLQHHSSKPSILQCSAFFIVQLPPPYMTTGKTIALTNDLCWQSNVSAF